MSTSIKSRKSNVINNEKDLESIHIIDSREIIPLRCSFSKVLFSCFMYSFSGVSMVIVNKSLAFSYNNLIDGDLSVFLVVFQAFISVLAVDICKRVGLIECPGFNHRVALQWAPINVFFCGMLFSGMASLRYNSVPMVTVFKNITNILVAFGEYIFFGNKPELLVVLAFSVMLIGAIAAAGNDFNASFFGILWMAINCSTTAAYILYMNFATKTIKLPKFGMVFYNNFLCLLFLLPIAIINGELKLFLNTEDIHTLKYYIKIVFAGLVGFFLNFASLNCVATTGPTTYAIIGATNKIPIIFLGYLLFDDKVQPETWIFIFVSMLGGFLYSYSKLKIIT